MVDTILIPEIVASVLLIVTQISHADMLIKL